MFNEVEKHRASTIQIAGFALMTPFGNIVVSLFRLDLFKFGIAFFVVYLAFTLSLFYNIAQNKFTLPASIFSRWTGFAK